MKEKSIISHQIGGQTFLEINSEGQFVNNVQDALDLLGALFGRYYDGGEILQKFSNYRVRLAIVGDWSKYTSHSFAAFIIESNRGRMVNFTTSTEEAVALLSRYK